MRKTKAHLAHYEFQSDRKVIFQYKAHKTTPQPVFDMHLSPEIGVVLSGGMRRFTDGVVTELPRGGVWIAGALEPHGRQTTDPGSKVAVFIISPEFFFNASIPGVDSRIWQAPFNTPAADRPLLIDEEFAILAERLAKLTSVQRERSLHGAQIQITLLEIMLHVNRMGRFPVHGRGATVSEFGRLRPAIERIYRSSRPIATTEAAQLCELSTSRFSRLFAQATGLSFSKFSLRYRLSQVARELQQSNESSLDELAEKWGFSDKSHLVHRFKRHYNQTPALYRKR